MPTTLTKKFPRGSRRGPTAKARLASAYQALFAGNGSKEDAELVRADLAVVTRFYMVTPPSASDAVRADHNGRRSVFLHIFNFLSMSDVEIADLERDAREEAMTSMQEGEFE